ncbi:16S rRNA (cytosine(1402)-N(4))-methyltransferase RsmH [Desulfoferrobacter suflitae]|uniref:16S rRNA (cytosine(1402)-N(4))-methyltransferase RsmH n=1 Tax=Desulfoferrobacter suflitae TaxID=2865782 RepID=UPI002164A0A6|nr:16S rRNA (cytosine(1402)-N(4))-methyltransferase RsmH [Desulfoferrobacter suflitae]MCK8600414.1 16S rRNA (cytosine(1402)-N(4))-methyltransferase RsmH [Desulfoferrobacter suflitae]
MVEQRAHEHIPVMREAVLDLLACRPGGLYVDGTVGGGGYAERILQEIEPDGQLVALDWDGEAIERVRRRLRANLHRVFLVKSSFANLPSVLNKLGFGLESVDGVVIDLGVSSFQLEDPERGFSFLQDGPLDMRMDQNIAKTAADLVNSLSEKELADLIFALGEDRHARRIARAIVLRRAQSPIERTEELAQLIKGVVPKTRDARRIHPATRTFQALRLAVNQDLDALETFLSRVCDILKPGGRLCIVSFHSLEDRMVKERFRHWAKACRCPRDFLQCQCEGRPLVRLLTKKPLRPTAPEIAMNPRARSARLRAMEKVSYA